MFSSLPNTNFNFLVTFIFFANAFNLDQSKILLFVKELKYLDVGKILFET